jgi:5-methylcytosine-specific restriction endonuclease McrA
VSAASDNGGAMSNPYGSSVYQRNRRIVLERAGHRCQLCGAPANTADHIRPLARGGTHDLANLRALCLRCNCRLAADQTRETQARRRIGRRSRQW